MGVFRAHVTRVLVAARLAFGAAIVLLTATWPAMLSAQAPSAPIVLDARLPDRLQRCVSAERLQASYERARAEHAGEHSSEQHAQALRVELRSVGDAQSDLTRVELRAFRGTRALGVRVLPIRERDCNAVPNTLALVLELLSRGAPPEADEPPTQATILPQPRAATDPESPFRAAQVAEPPPSRAAWAAGLSAGAFFGAQPRTAAALQLLAALQLPSLELRVRATVLWPERLAIAEGSVQMSAYELSLEGCPTLQLDPWALRVCVGPRLGMVRAVSRGFVVRNRNATDFSLYLGALPEVAFALSGTTWLQLSAGIALALQRPKFVLQFQDGNPSRELDGPEPLRAELGLGVSQIF